MKDIKKDDIPSNKLHVDKKRLHMNVQLVWSPCCWQYFAIFGTNDVYACFHSAPSDKVAEAENRACWEMRHGHLMAQSALPLALP